MKICFLKLLPGLRVVFWGLFFGGGSKSYKKQSWIHGKNICSLKEKNSLHVKYCWVVFMVSFWKQWPVDQLWPSTPVTQFTVIVFSFLLLPVNANISLNMLSCERCLRNLQKGIGFLSPQMACNTELNTQPKPDSVRNGLSLHQKHESDLNVYMDTNIWRSIMWKVLRCFGGNVQRT